MKSSLKNYCLFTKFRVVWVPPDETLPMRGRFKRKMMNEKSLIKMTGITKCFSGVVANDDVDFDLKFGEIHCILGENGAGKTTLMNILSGMYQADDGTITVRDREVKIRMPKDSLKLGIGMVYQHFSLVSNLTVLENLLLGFEGGFMLNLKNATRRLRSIAAEFGLYIDPQRKVQGLSVAEKQQTEILKILYHNSEVLILDEPSSMLAPIEANRLYQTLKLLRKAGKSIVLITHNLVEALAVADRISVMRSGKKTAELSGDSLKRMGNKTASDKILELMFAERPPPESIRIELRSGDEELLQIRNIEVRDSNGLNGLKRVSFGIGRGEIVGITGIAGEAQRLLAEVIAGQKRANSGQLIFRGQDITHLDVAQRFDLGIRYISADRMEEGCVRDMPLSDNSILQSYYRLPFSRYGILKPQQIQTFAKKLIRRFAIRAAGPQAHIGTLSGGNIQKLILARSMYGKPELLICSNPTNGLDAKTVRFIQNLLKEESRQGTAVLLITSDLDELFKCSHRIGVLFNGAIIDLMDRQHVTVDRVGKLMLGVCG